MTNELSAGLYYMYAYTKRVLSVFWIIILSILTLSFLINMTTKGFVQTEMAFPVYIFSSIYGFTIVKSVFPYFIKMGITRKTMFLLTGMCFFLISLFNTLALALIYKLTNVFYNLINISETSKGIMVFNINNHETTYQHIAQFVNDTLFTRGIIDITIMLFGLFSMMLLGLIFYNNGLVVGLSVILVLFLGFIGSIYSGYLIDFGTYIYTHFELDLFYKLFGIGLIIYLFSYFEMKRITIK